MRKTVIAGLLVALAASGSAYGAPPYPGSTDDMTAYAVLACRPVFMSNGEWRDSGSIEVSVATFRNRTPLLTVVHYTKYSGAKNRFAQYMHVSTYERGGGVFGWYGTLSWNRHITMSGTINLNFPTYTEEQFKDGRFEYQMVSRCSLIYDGNAVGW